MSDCRAAALWYARHGLRVHPTRVGLKLPILEAWQRRATTDRAAIAEWWTCWPDAGVAIATGADSGVIVADADPRHGGDDALHDLERAHGEFMPTWRCLTAGGGLHLYLRHPGDRVGNRAGLWRGIDVRGDGGYVVAPPTELEGGRAYAWEVGHAPHEVELAEPPRWLVALIGRQEAPQLRQDGTPLQIAAGLRNVTLFRIAAALRRYGIAAPAIADALAAINKHHSVPPLEAREIEKIAASAARYAPARTVSDPSGGLPRTIKVA